MLIAEIVVLALVLFGIMFYFGKKKTKEKGTVAALSVCAVIAAVISANIIGMIPLPTEQVTITATGEKNEEASSNEIAIKGIYVAGEPADLNNPVEGKWFWKGNVYMWRNENDPRQPDGTTRSIAIEIPIGKTRMIDFNYGQWNGIAEVTYNGETKRYDCFKGEVNDRGAVSAFIPDTDSGYQLGIGLLRLGLFAVIIAALLAYPVFCVLKYEYSVLSGVFVKHWDKLIYIALAVVYVIILQSQAAATSMWYDELWNVGWAYEPFDIGTMNVSFQLLERLWIYMVPYGAKNLLLLSQLLVAGAIFFSGLAGNQLRGKRLGIIISVLTASSNIIAGQCAFEFHYYPFELFYSSLALYLFVKAYKQGNQTHIGTIIIYGLSLCFMMDTSAFGIVISGIMLAADFLALILKKRKKAFWIGFVIPTVYLIFWLSTKLLATYTSHSSQITIGTPALADISSVVGYLCDNKIFFIIMLLGGISYIVVSSVHKVISRKMEFDCDYSLLVITLIPIAFIAANYMYSVFINPEHPLWLNRYFICIIMNVITIIGFEIDLLIEFIITASKSSRVSTISVTLCFALTMVCTQLLSTSYKFDAHNSKGYVEVAHTMQGLNEAYADNTIFLIDGNREVYNGMKYFITQKGKCDNLNTATVYDPPENLIDYKNVYVVNVHRGTKSAKKLQEFLDGNYNQSNTYESGKLIKYVRK